jgi:hypothetical protein
VDLAGWIKLLVDPSTRLFEELSPLLQNLVGCIALPLAVSEDRFRVVTIALAMAVSTLLVQSLNSSRDGRDSMTMMSPLAAGGW